jgi:hypothetical protein
MYKNGKGRICVYLVSLKGFTTKLQLKQQQKQCCLAFITSKKVGSALENLGSGTFSLYAVERVLLSLIGE